MWGAMETYGANCDEHRPKVTGQRMNGSPKTRGTLRKELGNRRKTRESLGISLSLLLASLSVSFSFPLLFPLLSPTYFLPFSSLLFTLFLTLTTLV